MGKQDQLRLVSDGRVLVSIGSFHQTKLSGNRRNMNEAPTLRKLKLPMSDKLKGVDIRYRWSSVHTSFCATSLNREILSVCTDCQKPTIQPFYSVKYMDQSLQTAPFYSHMSPSLQMKYNRTGPCRNLGFEILPERSCSRGPSAKQCCQRPWGQKKQQGWGGHPRSQQSGTLHKPPHNLLQFDFSLTIYKLDWSQNPSLQRAVEHNGNVEGHAKTQSCGSFFSCFGFPCTCFVLCCVCVCLTTVEKLAKTSNLV